MLVFPRLQQTPESRPLTDVQRYLAQLVAELNRDRAELDEQIAALQASPIGQGKQTPLVNLPGGVVTLVPHGLGRPFLGWIITRVAYGATTAIIQDASPNPDTSLYVCLHCAQPVTTSLWVF